MKAVALTRWPTVHYDGQYEQRRQRGSSAKFQAALLRYSIIRSCDFRSSFPRLALALLFLGQKLRSRERAESQFGGGHLVEKGEVQHFKSILMHRKPMNIATLQRPIVIFSSRI